MMTKWLAVVKSERMPLYNSRCFPWATKTNYHSQKWSEPCRLFLHPFVRLFCLLQLGTTQINTVRMIPLITSITSNHQHITIHGWRQTQYLSFIRRYVLIIIVLNIPIRDLIQFISLFTGQDIFSFAYFRLQSSHNT